MDTQLNEVLRNISTNKASDSFYKNAIKYLHQKTSSYSYETEVIKGPGPSEFYETSCDY